MEKRYRVEASVTISFDTIAETREKAEEVYKKYMQTHDYKVDPHSWYFKTYVVEAVKKPESK